MPSLFPNFIRKKKDGKSPKPSTGKPKSKSKSEGGHSVSLSGLFLCKRDFHWKRYQTASACKCSTFYRKFCFIPFCLLLNVCSDGHVWTLLQVSPLPELIAEPTGARSMSFVGTHEYLAPEIIKGDYSILIVYDRWKGPTAYSFLQNT